MLYLARALCLDDLSGVIRELGEAYFYVGMVGLQFWCYACVLEGKPVPDFPLGLCRQGCRGAHNSADQERAVTYALNRASNRRSNRGLQFTATLGRTLALLTKHGLDPHPHIHPLPRPPP